jgi:hypothetical protein
MHDHEWIRAYDKAASRLAPKGNDGRFDFRRYYRRVMAQLPTTCSAMGRLMLVTPFS